MSSSWRRRPSLSIGGL